MGRNTFFRCNTFDKLKFKKEMKKVFLIGIIILSVLITSCKKEEITTNSTTTNKTDTTNNEQNLIAKVDALYPYIKKVGFYEGEPLVNANVYLKYLGGNNGKYQAQQIASTGLTGLVARIDEGYVLKNDSIIVCTITGTPPTYGSYTFNIKIGGKSTVFDFEVLKKEPIVDKTNLLTALPWKISSMTCTSCSNSSQIIAIEDCQKDDEFKFNIDGKAIHSKGGVLCENETKEDEIAYWKFGVNQQSIDIKEDINVSYENYRIVLLDAKNLILETVSVSDGVTVKINVKYIH